jgi:UDP-2-acetamido-2,6-beta-L-arabino-hexul-4-ose reductase
MKVLVTGAKGFVGKNLVAMLSQLTDSDVVEYDLDSPESILNDGVAAADVIFHLAGINRPEKQEDYETGNAGFTQSICDRLLSLGRKPMIVFSSSIQAALNNPYGISKRRAEEALLNYSKQTDARVVIFRMKNVFGKWCRPNYNSAVATFCNNIARNLPISISDRANELNLVYVDDVCAAMMEAVGLLPSPLKHFLPASDSAYAEIEPSFKITLGALVDTINFFKTTRTTLQVPAFSDPFICRLYATYLSYLEESDFAYGLDIKTDDRGSLAEFLKSASFGQIFISRTKPGITRGNHYHHTKTEKFLVVQGEAIIRLRKIDAQMMYDGHDAKKADVIEYRVNGKDLRVVDIPSGYTHSIENIGKSELVTLFWASQIFDNNAPDTYFEKVNK